VVAQATVILGFFGTLVCAAVMGVPIYRDFEHKFHEIYFTTPINKLDYLGGRFIGSYLIAILVLAGIPIGLLIGSLMPWVESDKIGEFYLHSYWRPFVFFILPNIFVTGSLFFMTGAITRNLLMIYLQGALFIVLWSIANALSSKLENETTAALFDALGLRAFGLATKFMTPAEKNILPIPFTTTLIINRLIWITIGSFAWVIGYRLFSFSSQSIQLFKKKISSTENSSQLISEIKSISITPQFNSFTWFTQVWSVLRFEVSRVIRSIPFIAITLIGLILLITNLINPREVFGCPLHPETTNLLELAVGSMTLFSLIVITFYTGEMVWREKKVNINQIVDALPVPNTIFLLGKLFAMIVVMSVFWGSVIIVFILNQLFHGFTKIELGWLLSYFGIHLVESLPLILIGFAIHTLVHNVFLGHAVFILIYIANIALAAMGYNHNLYIIGGTPNLPISAMNGYGHFLIGSFAFSFYWLLWGLVALWIANLFWNRGTVSSFNEKLQFAKQRFQPKVRFQLVGLLVCIALTGGWIFYNTNILNKYERNKVSENKQEAFEKKYRRYFYTTQPRITATKVAVDLYPKEQRVVFKGQYWLKNISTKPIDTLIYYFNFSDYLRFQKIEVPGGFTELESTPEKDFMVCRLKQRLQPGDSIPFLFELAFQQQGFPNNYDMFSMAIVENGSFFNNTLLPGLGYPEDWELSDWQERKKRGLPKKPRAGSILDSTLYHNNYITDDGDWIQFETTISTDEDQIAIAPGYLQKEWKSNGRRYFHYQMDAPILNFYSWLSARYEVYRSKWKDVSIEIYYHKGHEYNLKRMTEAIQDALEYCSTHFSPYQHRQARIIEFPQYASFAQSFPNTIPYSEAIGFILNPEKPDAIDAPYYITAHEIAHQWWAHQVCGAPVQGMTSFSESLAEYSAMMVLKKKYGKEKMRKF
ncbi:MAG: hypothetical protein NZ108_04880, partial [Bacteroidia bacterium]|nr:hypothetical protein [Bacteroidia bacterium]